MLGGAVRQGWQRLCAAPALLLLQLDGAAPSCSRHCCGSLSPLLLLLLQPFGADVQLVEEPAAARKGQQLPDQAAPDRAAVEQQVVEQALQQEVEGRLAGVGPQDGALIIYTSGTTGRPKGRLELPGGGAVVGDGAWRHVAPPARACAAIARMMAPAPLAVPCAIMPCAPARRRAAHARQPGGAGGGAAAGVGLAGG